MSTFAKIAIIVLVILALGAAIFVYQLTSSGGFKLPGGLSFSSSSASWFLPSFNPSPAGLPGPSGGTGSGSGSSISQTPGTGTASTPPSITIDPSTIPASQIPSGFTAAQLSPYFHEIRFAGVSSAVYSSYGRIGLAAYFANSRATGTIDITGWQIKTRNSGEYIPQAIAVYDPSGLAAPSDVRLANGDMAYLYSSSAPFNLRLNECIGYISKVAAFKPALPQYCAQPDKSVAVNFTGACQQYVQSLSGCTQPNLSNPLVPANDYACRDYLQNNFNYKTCFEEHASDPHFLSNQVWIWTGSNVVNQYHDTVDLFDKNGLLVDQYVY